MLQAQLEPQQNQAVFQNKEGVMFRLRYCLNRLLLVVMLGLTPALVLATKSVAMTQPDSQIELTRQNGVSSALLFSSSLQQPEPPLVKILEADSNNLIKRTIVTLDFEFPLTLLVQNGRVDDLEVKLGPLTRTDGVVAASAQVTWASEGEQSTPLRLAANDRHTLILSGKLPEQIEYVGWLTLKYGDQLDVYNLSLTRSAPAGLTILEATDGKLALQVGSRHFERTVTVQFAQGQPAIDDLRVSLGPLTRQDGKSPHDATLDCSLCGQAQRSLDPGERLFIVLSGRDLELVTYLSTLQLHYQDQTQIIPLTVTRTELLQNLNLSEPATIAGVRQFQFTVPRQWWPPGAWLAIAEVDVAVSETAGQDSLIYYPRLSPLQLTNEKGETFSVSGEQIDLFHRETSGALTPIPNATSISTAPLAAMGDEGYVYRISRLDKPGRYTGQMFVSGPDSAKVSQTFTITIKDAWYMAFVVILIGVVLSYALQSWIQKGRQRALLNIQIGRVRESLPSPGDDPVWVSLSDKLQQVQDDNEFGTADKAQVTQALNDIQTRKSIYQQARQAYEQVGAVLKTYPIEPPALLNHKQDFESKAQTLFKQVQDRLQGIGGEPEEVGQKLTELQTLGQKIEVSAVKELAEVLQEQVQTLGAENPNLTTKANALLATITQDIVGNLDKKSLVELTERLQRANAQYASLWLVHLDTLLNQFEAEQSVAPNTDDEKWGNVKSALHQARDTLEQARINHNAGQIEEGMAALRLVQQQYLHALIERLDVLVSPTGCPSDILLTDWQEILRQLSSKLGENLTKARAHCAKGRYSEARSFYQQAQNEYLRVLVPLLRYRIKALEELSHRPPAVDYQTQWGQSTLETEEMKQALVKLTGVRDALPSETDAFHNWPQKYDQAHTEFITAQVEVLDMLRGGLQTYQHAQSSKGEWWKTTLPYRLGQIERTIQAAKSALDENKLKAETLAGDAQTDYKRLLEEISKQPQPGVQKASLSTGQLVPVDTSLVKPLMTVLQLPGALLQSLAAPVKTWTLSVSKVPEAMTARDWRAWIRANDQILAFAVLVLAAISGLTTLWVPNPTFGGTDYIAAFLWGLGLHQGLTNLVKNYTAADESKSAS